MAGKPIVVSQPEKDLIISGLEGLEASCQRLANRSGQLPYAVDAYKKQRNEVNALLARVRSWDTT